MPAITKRCARPALSLFLPVSMQLTRSAAVTSAGGLFTKHDCVDLKKTFSVGWVASLEVAVHIEAEVRRLRRTMIRLAELLANMRVSRGTASLGKMTDTMSVRCRLMGRGRLD